MNRATILEFKGLLERQLGDRVVFADGWDSRPGVAEDWSTVTGRPVAIIEHHTAGAEGTGMKPSPGVVSWAIAPDSPGGYCNAVVDRNGTVTIVNCRPAWHAGLGSFRGTRWARLGVPDNAANTRTWGIEHVSWGKVRDFTAPQIAASGALQVAVRQWAGWSGYRYRIANHADWAPGRKNDTLYPYTEITKWVQDAWQARKS